MKKSIVSVGAGVVFIVVLSTAVDVVMHAVGVFPPWGQPIGSDLAALALAYRLAIGVAGGWLTAHLAPASPMRHALILGGVGVALGLGAVVTTWNMDLSPRWYAMALVLAAIPQSVAGGLLQQSSGHRSMHSTVRP